MSTNLKVLEPVKAFVVPQVEIIFTPAMKGNVTALERSFRAPVNVRLIEVTPYCVHTSEWSEGYIDPYTTAYICRPIPAAKTYFVPLLMSGIYHDTHHIFLVGDKMDDGMLSLFGAVINLRANKINVSCQCRSDDLWTYLKYRFLAWATGGIFT